MYSHLIVFLQMKHRVMRIGLLNIIYGTSWPIGTAFSGVAFQKLGFYGVYYTSTVLFLLAFIFALIRIKKERINQGKDILIKSDETCMFRVIDFFNLNNFKSAMKITFKEEPSIRRFQIIMIITLYFIIEGPVQGNYEVV